MVIVCALCGAPAKLAENGNYRHSGEPWEDGSGLCEKYGYPIPVRVVSDAAADPNRKATPEDLRRLWDAPMRKLIAQHGKEKAKRLFAKAMADCGLDPNEVRVVFAEDIS